MKICFLRHGRSLADDERKSEGRYDSPLTEIGRRQAENLAGKWAEEGKKFDMIVASTLIRAHETASIIRRGEGSYLVVSHGGILNAVARAICGTQPPVDRSGLRFGFRDNGYLELYYNHGSHAWSVERFEPGVTVIEERVP